MYASIFRPGLFDGQTIMITGGGSGIGRCTAHELASLGAMVVITGRTVNKLQRTAEEIRADGGRVTHNAFDIRDEDRVRSAVAAILDDHGHIDGLVNNAGGQFPMPAEAIGKKGWESVLATNLTGGFLVSREVYTQDMKSSGGVPSPGAPFATRCSTGRTDASRSSPTERSGRPSSRTWLRSRCCRPGRSP